MRKSVLLWGVLIGTVVSVSASAGEPCPRCRTSSGNVVFMCSDGNHFSCSKCCIKIGDGDRAADKANQLMDIGSKTDHNFYGKCPYIIEKRYKNNWVKKAVCKAPIRKIHHDNRSAKELAAIKARENANAKKLQQGQVKIQTEHNALLNSFRTAVKNNDSKSVRTIVPKIMSHYKKHWRYTYDQKRNVSKKQGLREHVDSMNLALLDTMTGVAKIECDFDSLLANTALTCQSDEMIRAIMDKSLLENTSFDIDFLSKALNTGKLVFVEKLYKARDGAVGLIIVERTRKTNDPAMLIRYIELTKEQKRDVFGDRVYKDLYADVVKCNFKWNDELLAKAFANTSEIDKNFYARAAVEWDNVPIGEYLLKNGAQISDWKIKGYYPYHWALLHNNVELAKKLKYNDKISHWKLDIYGKDKTDNTLKYFIGQDKFESVKYLIEEEGHRIRWEHISLAEENKNSEMAKYLAEKAMFWDTVHPLFQGLLFPITLVHELINAGNQ